MSWLRKQFAKWALVVYRIGLGFIIAQRVLILTTRGRNTGRNISTPLWYVHKTSTAYILSRRGLSSHWLKNILAQPEVELQIGNTIYQSQGKIISSAQEKQQILKLFSRKYRPISRFLLNPNRVVPVAFRLPERYI